MTYEWHTSTYEWHTNDIRVHTSDIRIIYEWHMNDIRVIYEYIRVTYGWHTSIYELQTDDIRVTCGLLWLNPGAQGKHFTSQLPRAACVLWPLNIGLMLILLTFFDGEDGFTSMGSWCYSRGWVWNLRTKLCCIASGKWNVRRVSLQGFHIRYAMF